MGQLLRQYAERSQRVATLMRTPHFEDARWHADARQAIEAAQGTLAELRQPPSASCLQDVHAELLKYVASEEAALRARLEAVTSGNAALLTAAATHRQESGVYLNRSAEIARQAQC